MLYIGFSDVLQVFYGCFASLLQWLSKSRKTAFSEINLFYWRRKNILIFKTKSQQIIKFRSKVLTAKILLVNRVNFKFMSIFVRYRKTKHFDL